MLNLVVDSTHFKRDRSLNKVELSIIKQLGKNELIKLHIPWFVYKECISTYKNELSNNLNSISSSLKNLDRQGIDSSNMQKATSAYLEIEAIIKNLDRLIINTWSKFIRESKSILYSYDSIRSKNIFKMYFAGDPPFKSLKSRDDIPDAFIFQQIKKISESGLTYIVSNDKNLTKECSKLSNTVVFNEWDEFLNDKIIMDLQSQLNEINVNAKVPKNTIGDVVNKIEKNLKVFEDSVGFWHEEWNYGNKLYLFDESLNTKDGKAEVLTLENLETNVLLDKIRVVDDLAFIPIEVFADATIQYSLTKSTEHQTTNSQLSITLFQQDVKLKMSRSFRLFRDDLEVGFIGLLLNNFDNVEIVKNTSDNKA